MFCLFLGLITLAVYWQVIDHEFINYDDPLYITDNPYVQAGLSLETIEWSFNFTDKDQTYWHPLTWLSHILDCQLFGLNAGMHHLTNVILHVLNSVLLFLVFKRMTGALWKSFFVGALFALHPLNVDSVAWVAERKNVLSAFFWMLTMLSYAHYSDRPGLYRYLMTLLAFALGLLAKPMLVTLPFVLLLLDYWSLGRLRQPTIPSTFRLFIEKAPFLVLSGAAVYLSASSVEGFDTLISMELRPMKLRIANALVSYVNYMGKMIFPQGLAIYYPFPDMVPIWKAICAGLFLVLVSLPALFMIKRKPYFSLGWLWFLGTLVPVIGLVQVGLWPAMADRWAYIPLIGLFIMLVWGAADLATQWRHKGKRLAIISAMLFSILIATTLVQLRYWANSITLFEHTLDVTANNFHAHSSLGAGLEKQGRTAEAIGQYFQALQINPGYAKAHNNLGNALDKQGRTYEAIHHYSQALQIDPRFAEAHNNLAIVLANQGKLSEAIRHFSEALKINPRAVLAHYNLGFALANQDKLSEAIKHFSEALRINPRHVQAHNALGHILLRKGNIEDAVFHFREAILIKPDYVQAHNGLKKALMLQEK